MSIPVLPEQLLSWISKMDRRNGLIQPRFTYCHHIRHPGQDKSHQPIKVGVQAAGAEVNDTEPLDPALPAGQGQASSQRRKEEAFRRGPGFSSMSPARTRRAGTDFEAQLTF